MESVVPFLKTSFMKEKTLNELAVLNTSSVDISSR